MVATARLDEANLATESVTTDVSNCNFGNTDSPDLTPASYPSTAGQYSFDKWWFMYFSGAFNQIDNLQVWMTGSIDSETYYESSLTTSGYSEPTFAAPTTSNSTFAQYSIATEDPTNPNLGFGGSLAGNITATGSSDYMVSQFSSDATAAPGDVTQKTFYFQYDEQ